MIRFQTRGISSDKMQVNTLYLVLLFGSGVVAQPTTDQCSGDDCNDRQVVLMEQTLNELQTISRWLQSVEGRLQTMEIRQQSMESRQKSIERGIREDNGGRLRVMCTN